MGLIAGIYSIENKAIDSGRHLDKMIQCQQHRCQGGEPVKYINKQIAIAMVNPLDSIFSEYDIPTNSHNPISGLYNGIYAFTDGIVLDVPKHKIYFESNGLPMQDNTCSSIVAAAYQKWGLDFMLHLEGEFSCAIWDEKKKRLVLARDPFGHKPIHYYSNNKKVYFSSEIKGILDAGVNPGIDLTSLSDFLSLNCIPYPATIFKNIFQVPPGSLVIINSLDIKIKKYWEPVISVDKTISFENAAQMITESLKEAVKRRMMAKDAFCFLSGGMDSSAIVSFMTEVSSSTVHAVSVGFEEEEENELEDAAVMAKHVGAKLHQVIAKPDSFFDMLDLMVFHHDTPFTDTSAYPTFYAGKLGSSLTDVILTGDGPDQTMGGSGHYVFAVKNNIFANRKKTFQFLSGIGAGIASALSIDPTPALFSKIHRKLYRQSLGPVHAAYDIRSYFPDIVKKYLCTKNLYDVHSAHNPYRHPEAWFKQAQGLDDINKYLYADMQFYVPDDLMIKVDRMCMAHGLETLSPFQDIKLAEIVNKLPGHYKILQTKNNQIITKYILQKVCENRFPEQILTKKKQGFGVPLEKWLKQNNGEKIKEILLDPGSLQRGYFKGKSIEKFVNVFLENKGDYFFPGPNAIAGLLTLELWHRRYLDFI
ncbi:asparagine synthase (glutamine-hydrolyzing) [Desulfosarcina sp. BuS5]|uniref:asparagine synthetase B family protein n=1 Tax=Desulfosarcina sp. BuS5 TaxID=933262 RepID=UPI0004873FC4|nr:asparagine synthase-related protein [Desulfosarcina sp. BuS5]WDN87055.1 asparagine synthase (glutamine-hydrolyzing) [Desulfosarcina sp. BuS5]